MALGNQRALILLLTVALAAAVVPPARPGYAATFDVNSTADEPDATPGNGACSSTPSGACTLRAAIQELNAQPAPPLTDPHRINLPAGTFTLTIPGRDEVASATGDLNLTASGGGIAIIGQGATQTIVQAGTTPTNGIDRVFRIHSGANALLANLTVQHGVAGQPGALRPGGGILIEGGVTVANSEVRNNTANNDTNQAGGGGIANKAVLVLVQSAVIDNFATSNGGGISNEGNANIDTTTIANNRSGFAVGGVFSFNAPSTVLRSVSLVDNQATAPTGGGLGMFPGSPSFRIANTLLDSPVGRNCSDTTTIVSEGFNFASDFTCQVETRGNFRPRLSALGLHGGQTRNFVPLVRSGLALVDQGSSNAPCGGTNTPDQRGLPRPQAGLGSTAGGFQARCDPGAVEVPNLPVATEADLFVAQPAPGSACRNATDQCTLRRAVVDGNAFGGAAITLPAGIYTLGRAGRNEDAGFLGDLDVTAPLIVHGAGSDSTTVQAGTTSTNGIDRIFNVHLGAELVVRDMTLRHGQAEGGIAAGAGGAIFAFGELQLERVVVRNNASDSAGGGVFVSGDVSLAVTDSEIRDNTAGTSGGGISSSAISTAISGSTIAGNIASSGAGGGLNLVQTEPVGGAILERSTVSGNLAPTSSAIAATVQGSAGFFLTRVSVVDNINLSGQGATVRAPANGRVTINGSLFAENPAPNCELSGTLSGDNNLSDDFTCNVGPNTRLNTDPLLGQLRANGGPTRTHALLPGSPAIDRIPFDGNVCSSFDQRRFADNVDGDEVAGAGCDVGAFEVQRFAVTTNSDFRDVQLGDGRCADVIINFDGGNGCSLRGAIQEANAEGNAVVTVPAGVYALFESFTDENLGAQGDLDVTGGLTLIGASAATVRIVHGGGGDRVFDIRTGATARIQRVTIENGGSVDDGGGVRNAGTLVLNDVELRENRARSRGAGLASLTGSDTTLRRVTVAGNDSGGRGGGIYADGVMTLENVTISGNTAPDRGGGVFSDAFLTINNTTFNGNDADGIGDGNALWVNSGSTTISNNVFGRNPANRFGNNCRYGGGQSASLGFNKSLFGACTDVTGVPAGPGDESVITSIPLGNLANNGGQTRTHALTNVGNNVAVDGGNTATPLDGRGGRCAATDQRGQPRPRDGDGDKRAFCDAGAFEVQPTAGGFDVNVNPQRVSPGQPAVVTFAWIVPGEASWRDLESLSLRLLDRFGEIVFAVRWLEEDDRFVQLDRQGREIARGGPGSSTIFRTDLVSLDLRDTRSQGSGPTGQRVTLTLPLVFSQAANDQLFVIQVSGRADDGIEDPFADAATVAVGAAVIPEPGKKDDEPNERRLTEEQRQQRERTDTSSLDDTRTEGNAIETNCDLDVPQAVIANLDGRVTLRLLHQSRTQCRSIQPGDYLEAEGEKIHEALFEVHDLTIKRGGRTVR